jgi:hypothetical protein
VFGNGSIATHRTTELSQDRVDDFNTPIVWRHHGKLICCSMPTSEFLSRLEHHLATRLGQLDVTAHPSSDSPRRLTRQWTFDFLVMEAAKYPEFANLAALLRNVSEKEPELGT